MKTLIVYGTKYGTVEKCVEMLKKDLKGEVEAYNLKESHDFDVNCFDQVIIGGSIYVGKVQKEVKNFVSNHLNDLLSKKVGLFICGIQKDEQLTVEMENAFPKELLDHAEVKSYFGGEITYKKMKFFDRFIIKMISKADGADFPTLDENRNGSFLKQEQIDELIKVMNGGK